jgi:hypothetical protein
MTRRLGAALLAEALAIGAMLTITADLIAHTHVERRGGVNVWGYRGPVAHRPQPEEIRIAVVGGTRAFSWGGAASESVPAAIRWMVTLTTDRAGEQLRPIVEVNLGALGAASSTYASTLLHYAYLKPDYICIYDDLGRESGLSSRRRSLVFALSGYAPALPLALEEKGMALRYGSVRAGYGDAVVREPGPARRAAGRLLMTAGRTIRRVDESLPPVAAGDYVDGMVAAVDAARRIARGVVVAVGPAETERDRQHLGALQARLAASLARDRAIRLIDLTSVQSLQAPGLFLDGYDYSAEGRSRIAAAITPSLLELIERDHAAR